MLIGIISKAGIEKSLDLASKIADKISIDHDVRTWRYSISQ